MSKFTVKVLGAVVKLSSEAFPSSASLELTGSKYIRREPVAEETETVGLTMLDMVS